MKILVINGPNINLLGIREPDIYGQTTYADLVALIKNHGQQRKIKVTVKQSNYEGQLIEWVQQSYQQQVDGIVINPAAYTHTSIGLLDALKSVNVPTVEVHLSNPQEREVFRQVSFIESIAIKTIAGQGVDGYIQAIDYLINWLTKK